MEKLIRIPNTKRRVLSGVVTSDKMDKTVVVSITRRAQHPLYKKYINDTRKAQVHDEKNVAHVGDTVQIIESRPISKHKRWRLLAIVAKAR